MYQKTKHVDESNYIHQVTLVIKARSQQRQNLLVLTSDMSLMQSEDVLTKCNNLNKN